MDLSKLYKKLPSKIQESDELLILLMKISKTIRKTNSKSTPNYALNSMFKHNNVKITGSLRHIQQMYLELLRFIDNICGKYDLDYCLIYGTLIGAMRHEDFIPWDDDCDILMMRKDYEKLIEVLPQELKKNEFLKENCALTKLINKEENYFKDMNSIYNKKLGHDDYFNQPHLGKSIFLQIGWLKPMVKLDIFPYDYVKENKIDYYNKSYSAYKFSFRSSLFEKNNFKFNEEFNRIFSKMGLTLNKTDYIGEGIDASEIDDFGWFPTEYIFPLKTIQFENYEFKCPNKPDKLLKLWYGDDYMDIPSNITMHGYQEYNSTLFNSQTEMEMSFKNTIKKLKEINDEIEQNI